MDLSLFLRGMLVGVLVAVPVGPIGVLCVRRTILRGAASGLSSGLGAAVADTLFGCVAAFGLTAISDALIEHQAWLKLSGGTFLCAIGLRSLTSDPKPPARGPADRTLIGDFASTFALTLTNPVTIFALAAIFAALGVLEQELTADATATLVGGVFAGSASWWLLLAAIAMAIRGRLDPNHLEWIARIAGVLLLSSGLYVLASIAWPHLI
ncbi:MAG TPA: LysE family transporter [Alphaproteobacteria bacterium]|nr:LysE family transporter [Alphaproteobacteria bacterium]